MERELRELRKKVEEQDSSRLDDLADRVDEIEESQALDPRSWTNRFILGGYGEIHFNFAQGSSPSQVDIHRFVIYLGYRFADWIQLNSETEIEHAYVTDGSGGELVIEQLFIDFMVSDPLNIRVGRILVPLGIVNQKHEPTTFNGVERPSFDKYIIPTTWSGDGAGSYGTVAPWLRYELYVVGGLDGSEFDAIDGIRGGRIKERPGLSNPAVTGRLDFFPFVETDPGYGQVLRFGVSGYYGGIDNGNKGKDPDIRGSVLIYSADFEYSILAFDFRGVLAHHFIEGAEEIGNGTAEQIFGWYLEGAVHVMPRSLRNGHLARSDLVLFVRYDDFDTQFRMPGGVPADPAGDRHEWTVGATFFVVPNLVIKTDVQFRADGTGEDLPILVNIGVGWQF